MYLYFFYGVTSSALEIAQEFWEICMNMDNACLGNLCFASRLFY